MIHFNCSNLFIIYSTQFVVIEMESDEVLNLKVFNNPLINWNKYYMYKVFLNQFILLKDAKLKLSKNEYDRTCFL